jgi:ribosomal protein S18 acetylase RimI-like enzyme
MTTRRLTVADRGLLRDATLANMNWSGDRFTLADIEMAPDIAHYFDGFPGQRDFGLGDFDGSTARAVAWLVFLPAEHPGYGWEDADTPELSVTTFQGFRGRGVGTALLQRLFDEARARDVRAISLSVEDGNRARHLYERLGFEVVGRNGGSDTMLLNLG